MKKGLKHFIKRTLSVILACVMVLSLLPAMAFAAARSDGEVAETPVADDGVVTLEEAHSSQPLAVEDDPAGGRTYYVSTSGNGANDGLSKAKPLPGLDAVHWDQLVAGDSVLLKKGDTFPGAIRLFGRHGTVSAPITIGTYGEGNAPVIEARGQGIWLQETGSTATLGKYASSGVLLYDCSYITVSGLNIVNRPDALKATKETTLSGKSNCDTIAYSGVAVAADGKAEAEGITLRDITVNGDSDVTALITETSSTVAQTNVTKGAEAPVRTFTAASETYYVSSLHGNDSNDGTSQSTPFYSLHKINELNLKPGAKVYLERGSVFENQYLHIEGSGNESAPIIVDAYGTGATPVIHTNGNGVWYQNYGQDLDDGNHVRYGYVSSCIHLYDVAYIEIKNIGMTNGGTYGQTTNNFTHIGDNQVDGGTVPGETGYAANGPVGSYGWGGKMSRTGVSGVAQNAGTVHHVYLQNLDIENIYGNVFIKHMNNGGIYFTVAKPKDEGATGIARFDDVRVEGCYLKRTSRWGISVAYTGAYHQRFDQAQIPDETCETYGMTNLYVGHNYLEEVGGDPITVMYAFRPLVEYNVSNRGSREISASAYHNGSAPNGNKGTVAAGIWPWQCKTALFEHNECFNMLNNEDGNGDGQPWDADSGDSTIYQYNYSSGNTGGCIMFCAGQAYNSVFRYNISYDDGSFGRPAGVIDMAGNAYGQIHNNTFVMKSGLRLHYRVSGPAQMENNIFYNLGEPFDPQWRQNPNVVFNKNIYHGFTTKPDHDSNAIEMAKNETLFAGDVTTAPTAPKNSSKTGVGVTADGIRTWSRDWSADFNMFKLASSASKAINTGLPHTFTGLNQDASFGVAQVPLEKDFYGNTLDRTHDIGAFDTQTADPEGVTVSAVTHNGATIQWSAVANAASYKVALDDGEPVDAETLSYHHFSNLFPLAEYTVSVTAYDESGAALGTARTASFTTARPLAPANPDTIRPVAVKAGSEETAHSEGKENAIDGNAGTIWHTAWGGSNAADRWIAVDLGRVQNINNFKYLPRQDSGDGGVNGVITSYELYLSSNESDWNNPGGNWGTAISGTWANDKTEKTVTFNANTTAQYIKLKCIVGGNNHASAAEIAVNGTPCAGVTLADATVSVNKTVAIQMTTEPAGSAASGVVWTSSDRKVATVDGNGVVTGLSVGTTTITALLLNDVKATCTVTVTPRELSSACELVSSVFEVRDTNKLQVPFTEKNPTTVADVKAGLTVSEAATVQVLSGSTEQADTANLAAGMTVRIVAENGTSHTDYTVAQKNEYNHYNDWNPGKQGNVWFYQFQNSNDVFTSWDEGNYNASGWWSGGGAPGSSSAERNQACGSVSSAKGAGFTFRAPTDGTVEIHLMDYSAATPVMDQVKKRDYSRGQTSYDTYIRFFKNGEHMVGKDIAVKKDFTPVTTDSLRVSVAQGDTLTFAAINIGDYSSDAGGGVFFTPVITYLDEVYKPEATSVSLDKTTAALEIGETVQLTATVLPEGADQTVTWESTHPEYATVDENGLVTAVGNGVTAIIATATTSWGKELTASCEVTVDTKVTSITVLKDGTPVGSTPVKVYANDNHPSKNVTLTASVEPNNASNKTLNWNRPEGAQGMISIEDREASGASATITAIGNELNVGEVQVEVSSAASPGVKTSFTVQVIRTLENNVYVTGETKVGSKLTASTVDLVMKDAAKELLQYQWYRGAVSEENKIAGATGKQYEITEADIGATLSVTVTADPDTFYEGTRTAAAAQAVAKMDGPAAPEGLAVEPCSAGSADGKITGLDAAKTYEYSADTGTTWEDAVTGVTEITSLAAGTYLVRFAATDTQEASAAVTKTILTGATGWDISFDVTEGGSLDVDKNPAEAGDTITITVTPKPGNVFVAGSLTVAHTDDAQQTVDVAADNTFTMPAADVTVSAQFKKQTFTITHDMENVTCSLAGEHEHTVEYGDQPVITLNAKEGFTMPANVTVTVTGSNTVYRGYTYSHKAATPDTATLTFTQGITENLTISGTAPVKTYAVNYTLKNGLSAPTATAQRTVNHKAAYSGKLVADVPTQYKLPLGVTITMGGSPFTDFSYDKETGVISIAEGKITGNLVITAEGLDATVPVHPVNGVTLNRTSDTVQIGKTITLVATISPDNATEQGVTWQSSDDAIATVNENGVVTGVATGTVTITVTTVDGNRSATCNITVYEGSSGSGSSGSSTTTTETREDGTKVTTVSKPDGSKTQTVIQPDGTKSETATTKDGDVTITVTDENGEELVKTEIPATIPETETRFDDVPEGHWADEAIHNAAALKLVNGVGGNKFDMVTPMTRGSLATVLHRLSQGKTDYATTFKDVAAGKFYTEGVAWAAKVNVVKGVSDDIFAPDQVITREQLATMLARYAKLIGLDTKADAKSLEAFSDGDSTGIWAVDGMAWCVEQGILKGKGQNDLDPTADVSRAEVAVMLDRFIALIQK